MANFEQFMETAVEDGTLPGAVLMASNASGTFRYQKAFGKSDLPYELDSPMKIMSCTKLIASLCALQCVEKGLIGLDDDVSKHLPTLPTKVLVTFEAGKEPVLEDRKRNVTLRYLLTHSAGTPNIFGDSPSARYRAYTGKTGSASDGPTIEDRFGGVLTYQPGEEWEYGAGHDWVGKLVEVLTKTDLDTYVQKNIAAQLGIVTMTFWPQKSGLLERVPVTMRREGTDNLKGLLNGFYDPNAKLVPLPHNDWDDVSKKMDCFGGSGLTCSASDYIKVLHSLLADDAKILKPETVKQLMSPQLTPEAKRSLREKWFAQGFSSLAPGEYDEKVEFDWGLGAMLTLGESEGWRSEGTLMWSGLTNLLWFVDRKTDLCGIFATQMLPTGDDRVKKVHTKWEKEMRRLRQEAKSAE